MKSRVNSLTCPFAKRVTAQATIIKTAAFTRYSPPVLVGASGFVLVSQLVVLHSAEKEKENYRNYPLLRCGTHKRIGFPLEPFTNSSKFTCRLLLVDCKDTEFKWQRAENGMISFQFYRTIPL